MSFRGVVVLGSLSTPVLAITHRFVPIQMENAAEKRDMEGIAVARGRRGGKQHGNRWIASISCMWKNPGCQRLALIR